MPMARSFFFLVRLMDNWLISVYLLIISIVNTVEMITIFDIFLWQVAEKQNYSQH